MNYPQVYCLAGKVRLSGRQTSQLSRVPVHFSGRRINYNLTPRHLNSAEITGDSISDVTAM